MNARLSAVLTFARLIDDDEVLSITNIGAILALVLVGYTGFHSGTVDIASLCTLVAALGAYQHKKVLSQKQDAIDRATEANLKDKTETQATTDRRLDLVEAHLAALPGPEAMEVLSQKVTAIQNRIQAPKLITNRLPF